MAGDRTSMSTGDINDVFDGLAAAVDALDATPEVQFEVGEVPDARGGTLKSSPSTRGPSWPDPQRALTLARSRLASDIQRRRAELVRELAAWWADLASVALDSTTDGSPVPVARAAAGDPSAVVSEEDLPHLRGVSSFRDGGPFFVDQPAPDPRRDQLWGGDWTDYRVPPLPPLTELAGALSRCGVPADQASEVCQAREAIASALHATRRLRAEPDNEALLDRSEQLTDLLIDYARLLTDRLREIWSAAR